MLLEAIELFEEAPEEIRNLVLQILRNAAQFPERQPEQIQKDQ